MDRTRLLAALVAVIGLAKLTFWIWEGWGRISVDVVDAPVSQVIRSIEKQAGIKMATNLPADTKVTMRVKRVTLTYALEVLSGRVDARWSLAYVLAADKGAVDTAIAAFSAGDRRPDGYKIFDFGGRGFGDEGGVGPDPRKEFWDVKTPAEGTLAAYLESGSAVTPARFATPKEWNPAIASAPKSGYVGNVVESLAKTAGGAFEEVFMLSGRPRDFAGAGGNDNAQGGEGGGGGGGGGGRRFQLGADAGGVRIPGGEGREQREISPEERAKMEELIKQRMEASLAKMTPDQQAKAREDFAFFQSLRDLPADERRQKMQERMEQNPGMGDRMMQNMAKRDAMKSPEQRVDRWKNYQQRKTQTINSKE